MRGTVYRVLFGLMLIAGLSVCASARSDCIEAEGELQRAMQEAVVALEARSAGEADRLALQVQHFYALSNFEPAWFDSSCRPLHAQDVIDILVEASAHGMDPDAYAATALATVLEERKRGQPVHAPEIAEYDLRLTVALFRYLSQLHNGRVDPRQVVPNFAHAAKELALAEAVRRAMSESSLDVIVDSAAPRYPAYERLRRALDRYRNLEREAFVEPLPVVRRLRAGDVYQALPQLQRRLVALGDMAEEAQVPDRYTGEIVEAVRRFQARHGLTVDGVIGPATFEQLNVPLSQRIRQIELALERLRWLPRLEADRLIVINIPEFRLRALDVGQEDARVLVDMRAIVGRAFDTETPVFLGRVQRIELSPYWNVPASIATNELVPRLRRDPAYLQREGMEFVGAGARVSSDVTAASLNALSRGELRIRQRPGPRNVLGGIKFPLSSSLDIYLHGTDVPALFSRTRRDLSHGCVRLERPEMLAAVLLEDQPDWTIERIQSAMHAQVSSTVNLTQPVPVLIFYTTTVVEPGGRILFLPDIYGHDRALERALRAASPSANPAPR